MVDRIGNVIRKDFLDAVFITHDINRIMLFYDDQSLFLREFDLLGTYHSIDQLGDIETADIQHILAGFDLV